MKTGTLKERVRTPYREHSGKFKVNIGNGEDPDKYDWVYIEQENGSGVVLVKHRCLCVAFDSKRFKSKDFNHPLNARQFESPEEAYEKLMKWIGKMVKKDDRGRYYTDTRYKEYTYSDEDLEEAELIAIAKKI